MAAPASSLDLAARLLHQTRHDPYQFVMRAFPWGEPGTMLEHYQGPRTWQAEILHMIGEHLRGPDRFAPLQVAIASGHGIGKSALMAFVMLWGITTYPEARGVITANTEGQLRTKTWPELRKWLAMCAVNDFFVIEGMSFRSTDRELARTWVCDATPWSESNPEAFAGLHNEGKRILSLMDEASAIHDAIWTNVDGTLTDANTEIIRLAFGNPTRPKGRFFDCFSRFRRRWHTRSIDSRTVEGTNKQQLNQWVEDWGEDSDFVRVRVRGMFPKSAPDQLIPEDLIEAARSREEVVQLHDPLIAGIDVARFGDDQSVMYFRKGKTAGIRGPYKWRGRDIVSLADEIIPLLVEMKPHYVNIDGGGVGGGLVDVLRSRGFDVHEVQFGSTPLNPDYLNKRAEMWCNMRDWLREGGSIPWHDQELAEDLRNQTYQIRESRRDVLLLTPKDVMKRDGLSSPDSGDALALTFARVVSPVAAPGTTTVFGSAKPRKQYVRRWR